MRKAEARRATYKKGDSNTSARNHDNSAHVKCIQRASRYLIILIKYQEKFTSVAASGVSAGVHFRSVMPIVVNRGCPIASYYCPSPIRVAVFSHSRGKNSGVANLSSSRGLSATSCGVHMQLTLRADQVTVFVNSRSLTNGRSPALRGIIPSKKEQAARWRSAGNKPRTLYVHCATFKRPN